MMTLINIDRLKIYGNYGGDIDGKGLVSKKYADNSINKIKSLCDKPAFNALTKTITSYLQKDDTND